MTLSPGTPIEDVFGRMICFEYYDGPVGGLAEAKAGREVYRFEKVAWDAHQDLRVFLFASVRPSTFEMMVKRLAVVEPPRWPLWVPHLKAELADEVSSTVTAQRSEIVIASDDALSTIKVARRIQAQDQKHAKDLVDTNASVGAWLHYIDSQ